jgi:hypothetical protein
MEQEVLDLADVCRCLRTLPPPPPSGDEKISINVTKEPKNVIVKR